MRFHKISASAVLLLALAVPAAGAFASQFEPATPVLKASKCSDLSVPDLPDGVPDYGISNEMLIELAQTQTQEEIDRIAESDLPAVTLVDDNGKVIAAAATLEMEAIAAS